MVIIFDNSEFQKTRLKAPITITDMWPHPKVPKNDITSDRINSSSSLMYISLYKVYYVTCPAKKETPRTTTTQPATFMLL